MTAQAADSSRDGGREMERDARANHIDGHKVKTGEIAIGVIIGRTSEFFDFFVYAIASVLVFPALMFPFADRLTGTMYSFAIFALAFIARPFGTWLFTWIDQRYGRGLKLTIALFMLGLSTVAVAFLPAYQQIGSAAIILLAVLRIGQGIALGGTWDGLSSLLALNVPDNRRGWYAMIPQLGAPLGLIVASALFAFSVNYLGREDFLSWGWRYPFFVAFALNVVALFARLRMVVTAEYTTLFESRDLQPSPVIATLRTEGRNVVLGAFSPLASFAMFHMVTVFPLSYIYIYTAENIERFLVIEMIGAGVGLVSLVASGLIADRIGRRKLLGWSAGGIAIFALIAPLLLEGGDAGEVAFMIPGFILLGLSFGQSSGALTSNFSAQSRYTGAALTSDLAWLVGAGFAPLVALFLTDRFGLVSAGLYLLSGAVCTLIALRINRELAQRYS